RPCKTATPNKQTSQVGQSRSVAKLGRKTIRSRTTLSTAYLSRSGGRWPPSQKKSTETHESERIGLCCRVRGPGKEPHPRARTNKPALRPHCWSCLNCSWPELQPGLTWE